MFEGVMVEAEFFGRLVKEMINMGRGECFRDGGGEGWRVGD